MKITPPAVRRNRGGGRADCRAPALVCSNISRSYSLTAAGTSPGCAAVDGGGGASQDDEGGGGPGRGEPGRDGADRAQPRDLAQEPDADDHAGGRGDRGDDWQGDHRPGGLVGGLREQKRAEAAGHHGVDRPGARYRGDAAPGYPGQGHRRYGQARVGQPGRRGQQQRPAPPGGGQARDRRRDGRRARRCGTQPGGAQPVALSRIPGRAAGGQREERPDPRDHGRARRPRGSRQRPARPHPDDRDTDDELGGDDHLDDRQRPGPQRDGMRGKTPELRGDAEQPGRLAGQEPDQPRAPGRRGRRPGGLMLLERGADPVQDGREQRAEDHRCHVIDGREDVSRLARGVTPVFRRGLTPPRNRGLPGSGLSPLSAPARQDPHNSTSLLTVAQLRAVPPTRAEVGPPALASTRRSSLPGYPSGVCR
jgi:hypothetical protein